MTPSSRCEFEYQLVQSGDSQLRGVLLQIRRPRIRILGSCERTRDMLIERDTGCTLRERLLLVVHALEDAPRGERRRQMKDLGMQRLWPKPGLPTASKEIDQMRPCTSARRGRDDHLMTELIHRSITWRMPAEKRAMSSAEVSHDVIQRT